jgi:hypothetical protein
MFMTVAGGGRSGSWAEPLWAAGCHYQALAAVRMNSDFQAVPFGIWSLLPWHPDRIPVVLLKLSVQNSVASIGKQVQYCKHVGLPLPEVGRKSLLISM